MAIPFDKLPCSAGGWGDFLDLKANCIFWVTLCTSLSWRSGISSSSPTDCFSAVDLSADDLSAVDRSADDLIDDFSDSAVDLSADDLSADDLSAVDLFADEHSGSTDDL